MSGAKSLWLTLLLPLNCQVHRHGGVTSVRATNTGRARSPETAPDNKKVRSHFGATDTGNVGTADPAANILHVHFWVHRYISFGGVIDPSHSHYFHCIEKWQQVKIEAGGLEEWMVSTQILREDT
ncbi:hypothetical protein K438DRAFT_1775658 [Mycena galopus ATCC 62051]|nr:hypothetical protein K438DRAFT_1775658 [Mycena galopus ATCC 62051]